MALALVMVLIVVERRQRRIASSLRSLSEQPAGWSGVLDEQTGLPNAAFFRLSLRQRIAVARRRLEPVTIALIDFPGDVTDAALAIRRVAREADLICRIGPRRLGLVLDGASPDSAQVALSRLWASAQLERRDAHVGVASYPEHALDAAALVESAETALDALSGYGVAPRPGREAPSS
jgi:GGDEF domain-containing protein